MRVSTSTSKSTAPGPISPTQRAVAFFRSIPSRRSSKDTVVAESVPDKSLAGVPEKSRNKQITPRKLQKVCITHESFKDGRVSVQDEIVVAADYHKSEVTESIYFETSGGTGIILGILALESPIQGKRFMNNTRTTITNSIGQIVHTTPPCGHFRDVPRDRINNHKTSRNAELAERLEFDPPLSFDHIVVLARKLSSRRSRRILNSAPRSWFIQAMWEGMKRLKTSRSNDIPGQAGNPPYKKQDPIPDLVDDVMGSFGHSLMKFHHKVLKFQQKSDRSANERRARQSNIRQEIVQRNRDIDETLESSQQMTEEDERLTKQVALLKEKLEHVRSGQSER